MSEQRNGREWARHVKTKLAQSPLGPVVRRIVPPRIRRDLHARIDAQAIGTREDRIVFEEEILPKLARQAPARVLFVGCQRYTRDYGERFFASPRSDYWTTDIDPDNARWGQPGRHVVEDVARLDASDVGGRFDLVIYNGVYGFEPAASDITAALTALGGVLKPEGVLLVGWSGHAEDPMNHLGVSAAWIATEWAELPARRVVHQADNDHIFDLLRPSAG